MTTLANLTITTAVAAQTTTPIQFRDGRPENVAMQANLTYGSGGTTVDAWVQMSLDDGLTWIDCTNFHFTTSSLRVYANLSALTVITVPYTATDGTLAANTSKDGVVGSQVRIKYTTVGTYAGGTTLRIDLLAGVSRGTAP